MHSLIKRVEGWRGEPGSTPRTAWFSKHYWEQPSKHRGGSNSCTIGEAPTYPHKKSESSNHMRSVTLIDRFKILSNDMCHNGGRGSTLFLYSVSSNHAENQKESWENYVTEKECPWFGAGLERWLEFEKISEKKDGNSSPGLKG